MSVWSKPFQIAVLPERNSFADMNKSPPLQQFMGGVPAANTKCADGLVLLIKTSSGLPICVTSYTATKLIERGWAKKPNPDAINELSPQITTVTIPSGF